MKRSSVIKVDPEIMSGTPCFTGTRVPARTLIDYIESGDTLDEFLEDFPTVSRVEFRRAISGRSQRRLAGHPWGLTWMRILLDECLPGSGCRRARPASTRSGVQTSSVRWSARRQERRATPPYCRIRQVRHFRHDG